MDCITYESKLSSATRAIPTLPADILDEIAPYMSLLDLLSLCIVSQALNASATRQLYISNSMSSSRRVVKFCKAILANPLAAVSVRALSIDDPAFVCSYTLWLRYSSSYLVLCINAPLSSLASPNSCPPLWNGPSTWAHCTSPSPCRTFMWTSGN